MYKVKKNADWGYIQIQYLEFETLFLNTPEIIYTYLV